MVVPCRVANSGASMITLSDINASWSLGPYYSQARFDPAATTVCRGEGTNLP